MVDHVLVRFEGEGAGVDVLSWGQRTLWGGMVKQKTWMPLRFVTALPAGTTVEGVAEDLRFLMNRYQTMRTRLRFDPDGVKQVVSGSGEVPLEVFDTGPDGDPARLADEIAQEYWDRDYDFTTEWPVRMAVVRHRGDPTHLVSIMCHLVTDALGGTVMLAELSARTGEPVTASGPLAQARWQRSPAGQRQCATALRHWEGLLRAIPARRFPAPDGPQSPRYWHARFTSPATHLAVRGIAGRTGADSASVLLALFAVGLTRATGIDPAVTRVVVSNRFRPGLADTVSPVSQSGLFVLDVAGVTVDEVVLRAQRRAMVTYKYAYYDPPQLDALVDRVGHERGEEIELGCFFNDRRLRREEEPGAPATPEQVRNARALTTFAWETRQDDKPYEPLFVHVDDVADTVALSVFADTRYVSPALVEACVRGMEEAAVAAGSDPDAPTGRLLTAADPAAAGGR